MDFVIDQDPGQQGMRALSVLSFWVLHGEGEREAAARETAGKTRTAKAAPTRRLAWKGQVSIWR